MNILAIAIIIFGVHFCTCQYWEHELYVNQDIGNDSLCLQKHIPCATVNMALKGLKENTVVYISPGNYKLKHGEETFVIDKYSIAIIGTANSVLIDCEGNTALAFSSIPGIQIVAVTFHNCTRKYTGFFFTEGLLWTFYCGLCFYTSGDISVEKVTIQSSQGTGLLLVNAFDDIIIMDSVITKSRGYDIDPEANVSVAGGGIISVHDHENTLNSYIENLHILRSIISDNDYWVYPLIQSNFRLKFTFLNDFLLTSYGGGIVVLYHPILFIIDSCNISGNTGSGLFMDASLRYQLELQTALICNTSILFNQKQTTFLFSETNDYDIQLVDLEISSTLSIIFTKSRYNDDPQLFLFPRYYQVSFNKSINFTVNYTSSNRQHQNIISIHSMSMDDFCLDSFCSEHPLSGMCPSAEYISSEDFLTITSNCSDTGCKSISPKHHCYDCTDGSTVSVNSPYLICVPCNNTNAVNKGWALLIGLEFIPLTVMVGIIAFLNVNLNQGSLGAYVFFCQMLTILYSFLGDPFLSLNHPPHIDHLRYIGDLLFQLLSVFNLDFIRYYHLHESGIYFCISQNLTPLGALLFWYVIALYPLLLLMLLYVVLVLYNRGHRCIVFFVRPLHRVLARAWRMFDIHPSMTHTISSVYTLCFAKLVEISFKILKPWRDEYGNVIFYYDYTQKYFLKWHALAGLFAILVLLVLAMPTVYLIIHPFSWFQKFLNKLKFKKVMLFSLVEVFTGPYKNGTGNTFDYRYFASGHFIMIITVSMVYCFTFLGNSKVLHIYLLAANFFVYTSLCFVFRPFTKNIHILSEAFVSQLLSALLIFHVFIDFSDFLIMFIVSTCIVLLVVCVYCLVWMFRKCVFIKKHVHQMYTGSIQHIPAVNTNSLEFVNSDVEENFNFQADRLLNPERYNENEQEATKLLKH